VGGKLATSSEGVSNSNGNIITYGLENTGFAGTGSAGGNSETVGTSNAFIGGQFGGGSAGGTSGGNSTANADITIESLDEGVGIVESIGLGIGASGGYGVFGPSLTAAVAAATPPPPDLAVNPVTVVTDTGGKKGKGGKNNAQTQTVTTPVVQAPALVFSFTPGLATGGGGAGLAIGQGTVNATVKSTDPTDPSPVSIKESSGVGTATGFGFGVGNGGGINNGYESGGGQGGGTALGVGNIVFEVDDILTGVFNSEGTTTSVGGSAGYVGYAPKLPENIFEKLLGLRFTP
jgi:hypothetical protein